MVFFFGDTEVNRNSWMKLDGQYGQCTWADLEVTHELIFPTEQMVKLVCALGKMD